MFIDSWEHLEPTEFWKQSWSVERYASLEIVQDRDLQIYFIAVIFLMKLN